MERMHRSAHRKWALRELTSQIVVGGALLCRVVMLGSVFMALARHCCAAVGYPIEKREFDVTMLDLSDPVFRWEEGVGPGVELLELFCACKVGATGE